MYIVDIIGDAYSMKTYQSITSLATSPAISSNSLYSNGFFVTLTPPPSTASQPINCNNKLSTYTAIPTNAIKTCNSTMTPILGQEETTTNRSSFKNNESFSFDTNNLHNEHQIVNCVDEQLNGHNDIQILINNYDKKILHLQKNDNIDNDCNDDELSVENTRL